MTNVYIVFNEYRTEDGEGVDILSIWATREQADEYLSSWTKNLHGNWSDNDSVFYAENAMPLDIYYVEEFDLQGTK